MHIVLFRRHNFWGPMGWEQVSWKGKTPYDIMADKLLLFLPVWKFTQSSDALRNTSWIYPSQGSSGEVSSAAVHLQSQEIRAPLRWYIYIFLVVHRALSTRLLLGLVLQELSWFPVCWQLKICTITPTEFAGNTWISTLKSSWQKTASPPISSDQGRGRA